MENQDLFNRAISLRDADNNALRLLINARRGVPGAQEAYQAWLNDMTLNHTEDLRTIMLHVESNVTKMGELLESIHNGQEPSDVDKSFLIQMIEITGGLDDIH